MSNELWMKNLFLCAVGVALLSAPAFAHADSIGDRNSFYVNTTYDEDGRSSLYATLKRTSEHAYYYLDDSHWDSLTDYQRELLDTSIRRLSDEFENVIYPKITAGLGSEPNPGIDDDPRITILLERLIEGNGGYFETVHAIDSGDTVESNKREMLAISAQALGSNLLNVFVAHEFQHLVSMNYKELQYQVSEETWLNEMRSEYAVSLVGYNTPPSGTTIKRRILRFANDPSNSLTEWPNTTEDYAVASLFAEYLGERYGSAIFRESLQSGEVGMESLDTYFRNNGLQERFADVFSDWMAAVYLNDRSIAAEFGYKNKILEELKFNPTSYVTVGKGGYTVNTSVKDWQPRWIDFYLTDIPTDRSIVRIDINGDIGQRYTVNPIVFYSDGSYNSVQLTISDGHKTVFVAPQDGVTWKVKPTRILVTATGSQKTSGFSSEEEEHKISIGISFATQNEYQNTTSEPIEQAVDTKVSANEDNRIVYNDTLSDGMMIKRNNNEKEMYVIWGKYKRYLRPEIIALYGQLNPATVVPVSDKVFFSYTATNYIRNVNDEKVYAVWPDGTKHWLNISASVFDSSGRDWNSIFIINDAELSTYVTGVDITR